MTFIKGFTKGFLLLLTIGFLGELLNVIFGYSYKDRNINGPTLIILAMGFVINIYFINKYKQPKAWIIPALIIGPFTLPFLMGSIETQKNKKPKKK